MSKFEFIYSRVRALATLYQVWNVLLTMALKRRRSPTVDGPRNLNMSTDFRSGCPRQKRLRKQREGMRQEMGHPPRYFQEMLIRSIGAKDQCSRYFVSKHLLTLVKEMAGSCELGVVLHTTCKYLGTSHVPKPRGLYQGAGASAPVVTVLPLFCSPWKSLRKTMSFILIWGLCSSRQAAHDYNHRTRRLPGWTGAPWRPRPAAAIHTRAWAPQLGDSPAQRRTHFPHGEIT